MSAVGPSRHFAWAQQSGRFWREADINWKARSAGSVANDPKPKIGEHKVVRYLDGPPGGQNEDTRWWTFAF
jgi:hypothetical protein